MVCLLQSPDAARRIIDATFEYHHSCMPHDCIGFQNPGVKLVDLNRRIDSTPEGDAGPVNACLIPFLEGWEAPGTLYRHHDCRREIRGGLVGTSRRLCPSRLV